ncbi:MAG TPA: HAD-IIA family hydrolase [Chromatiaceae bacterium]|jgi:4-nitrophenyl phosphatase|nr:MAG: hypothetical protein N838_16100 [Thiohalocapsa sp. PB-PSB1]QQO54660.1 MAG: HAD-IIA family hydrolase [Thiohalocapsa sp. PB-PSB1]HBG97057.1 HAD-IIA family hydrolase [Chromatiaceae bacterium]HCS89704.1 HAD-IIA family hydrolase [Chromatiaceae bacterium]
MIAPPTPSNFAPGYLAAKRCWLLDGDGVLYQDGQPLPAAIELIRLLRQHDRPLALLTNTSAKTPAQIAADLSNMNIELRPEEIATSASAAVAATMPMHTAMVLGGDGILDALSRAKVTIVKPEPSAVSADIDAVFVGMDRQLTYQRLSAAVLAIQRGARFIATNADRGFPTRQGLLPGAGSIVAAISAVVGREPEFIAGKPGCGLFLDALARANTASADAIMIGDQLETDILGAMRAGIDTILVGTGIAGRCNDAEILHFQKLHGAPTHMASDLIPILHRLDQDLRSP